MWTTLLFGGTAFLFAAKAASSLWHVRWLQRLPDLKSLIIPGDGVSRNEAVRCSVVIAARDEEARIEPAIRRLLAQDGVEIELIVVDDRSSDRTGEILRQLAHEDARLQVRRVDALPDGWLGKCHACHIGASAAHGNWILFTDADCWLKPDVIARAVRLAERDRADHVTMTPGTVINNPWARAWFLLFLTSLLDWFSGVNRDRPKAYLGIGAFNLVRAAAYRRCGGYEALRLTVVDDVKLGLLLRRAGNRTRAFLGADDVECHWAATVPGMVKIMEKNYFAILNYRLWLAIAGGLFMTLVLSILVLGLTSGTTAGLAAVISPFLLVLPGSIIARRLGWSWTCAIWIPFMFPVFLYALLNSTYATVRRGGVRWRETFYPLETLRSGNVR